MTGCDPAQNLAAFHSETGRTRLAQSTRATATVDCDSRTLNARASLDARDRRRPSSGVIGGPSRPPAVDTGGTGKEGTGADAETVGDGVFVNYA
jgi:hypothetical protein